MQGPTHIALGVCLYASALLRSDIFPITIPAPASDPSALLVGVVLVVGTLLPDIDHPQASLAQQRFLGVRVLRPISQATHAAFGHRGFLHSMPALLCVTFLAVWASTSLLGNVGLGAALAVGYASHLLADMITPRGIPLLSPFSNASFGLSLVRTGSNRETLFLCLVVAVTVLFCTHQLG